MKAIILMPNQNNLEVLEITVSNRDFRQLQKMQYEGGFERFRISLYDDEIKGGKTDVKKLSNWLNEVFITTKK